MRIAVDAMGGDHAPAAVVRGAALAARTLGVEIALVGQPEVVGPLLAQVGGAAGVAIVPAADVIAMDAHGAAAARQQRDSSIVIGLREVKEGRADAFVSAGNTGAVMAAAVLVLGRVRGIERPALGAVFPARAGGRVLLLDAGANADVKPAYLVQFGQMGAAFVRHALGVAAPRVGLLSIGEEAAKGNQLVQEAHPLLAAALKEAFAGNVESRDVLRGNVDVVVTDGFTGNVVLKTAEGAAEFILGELRTALTAKLAYKLAAAALRPAFRQVRQRIDYQEYGGAPLLGVRGVVFIAHGRSEAPAIVSAVRAARDAVAGGTLAGIEAVAGRG